MSIFTNRTAPQTVPVYPSPQNQAPPVAASVAAPQYQEPAMPDLNGEAIRAYTDGPQFLPYGTYSCTLDLCGFRFVATRNGPAYFADFVVIESSDPGVIPGTERAVMFALSGKNADAATIALQRLRKFLAVLASRDGKDPTFDANKAAADLRSAFASGVPVDFKLHLSATARLSQKGKEYTDFRWTLIA